MASQMAMMQGFGMNSMGGGMNGAPQVMQLQIDAL